MTPISMFLETIHAIAQMRASRILFARSGTVIAMTIGLYTSKHYSIPKKEAIEEAAQKLGIDVKTFFDDSFNPSLTKQAFGFEELLGRTKKFAAEALRQDDVDVGIGIENSLSFIFSANEWYYVICIAVKTREGGETATFTPGIGIPQSMVKEVQEKAVKIDAVTQRIAGEDDPVAYFSQKTLTRKDLMVPALLLAFANLGLGRKS